MEVQLEDGREVTLTDDEVKVVRLIRKLNKMKFGRIQLFGSGWLDVRLNDGEEFDGWAGCVFESTTIPCEGGDGGDYKS